MRLQAFALMHWESDRWRWKLLIGCSWFYETLRCPPLSGAATTRTATTPGSVYFRDVLLPQNLSLALEPFARWLLGVALESCPTTSFTRPGPRLSGLAVDASFWRVMMSVS